MLGSEYIKALLGTSLESVTVQPNQTQHVRVAFLLFLVAFPLAQQVTANPVRLYWQSSLLLVRATAKHSYATLRKSKESFLSVHHLSPEADSKWPVICEAICITGYILSSILSRELFCCKAVFFSLPLLISSLWWCNTCAVMRQVHDNVYAKADTAGKFRRDAIFHPYANSSTCTLNVK